MVQSVRVEFVRLGKGGAGNPENVITALVGTSVTLSVGTAATSAINRPAAPNDEQWDAVRLTAIGNPVFVHWKSDEGEDATLTNSLRLCVEIPEIVVAKDPVFSFIAEQA